MDRRQNEMERLMLDYEKQCLKDLQKSYTEALADVKQRLRVLLSRQEETPTTSIAYQVQFQRQLEDQLQNALDTLKRGNVTSVNDFLNKTYEDSYLGTIYGIQGQGIPINIGIDHEQMARTINRKTDTFKFSERLYKNVDELGVAFKSQMTRGIANNFGYSKIAKQLAMESEASYKQAMRIVRTEGGRVKSEAKLNSMKAAKNEGADIVKQWDATFDGKTRAEHRFLDGQIKEIDEPFVDSQGREAQAPHKFGVASMDVNCRCIVVERARWAVEGEEMPNKVDNVTGELVEGKNYREWKEKYQKQNGIKQELEKVEEVEKVNNAQTPNNIRIFDKNSSNVPSVDDYFKTPSNELIKITEVNDYNGVKTVTLENGRSYVLSNTQKYSKEIEELKKQLEPKKKEILSVIDKDGNVKYLTRGFNKQNQPIIELTDDPEKALAIKNEKGLAKKASLIEKGYKDNQAFAYQDILSYSEKEKIKKQISAYENGFESTLDYDKYLKDLEDKRIAKKTKLLESSFVFKNKRSDMYGSFQGDYQTDMFEEVISRVAKKELGAVEIHSSAKSGSKFGTSVYLEVNGYELRLSNHYLPDTAQREFNHSSYGTRWQNELVLTQSTMEEIAGLKTKDEFVSYLKNLFDIKD